MALSRSFEKSISGCAIAGIMDTSGSLMGGSDILRSIACMRVRSNGLGGGFAAYGIYPDYEDLYALHMMYIDADKRDDTEKVLSKNFKIVKAEKIPTRKVKTITDHPVLWRYFVEIKNKPPAISEDDYLVKIVMDINSKIDGAYVASSGKNMGVFKGVGFPEDIGRFYRIEEYEAYTWTAHGRFPTNTAGWWGGAHPFNILDWSVIHNGELSSYGINKRCLEGYGYICTLMTDTEVVAYTMDLLVRKHKLSLQTMADVIASPLWTNIDRMDEKLRANYTKIRQTYGSLLMNGPFSFIVANKNLMVGITDRIRLRPLIGARKDNKVYIATEESAIREISPELDEIWLPRGGELITAKLKGSK